jgi:hypothetical protein
VGQDGILRADWQSAQTENALQWPQGVLSGPPVFFDNSSGNQIEG